MVGECLDQRANGQKEHSYLVQNLYEFQSVQISN